MSQRKADSLMSSFTKEDIETIRESELFDSDWYLDSYPDVKVLGMDPAEHYLWLGARLNRDPSPHFDTATYVDTNLKMQSAEVNPLLHYHRWGRKQKPQRVPKEHAEHTESPNIHCSTFFTERPFVFATVESLDAIGKRYLENLCFNKKRDGGVAIFTSITGQHDNLNYHQHLLHNADYYVFSDEDVSNKYVFNFKKIPYYDRDPVRAARFVKTHPHMLLAKYDVAVWIDGNILIRGDISDLIRRFKCSGLPVAAIPHPLRSSVYEEAQECIKRSKDNPETISEQMARYQEQCFNCTDLIESNFMMFRLGHPKLAQILTTWWAEIDRGSRRDQLSFNYAMRHTGTTWFPLTQKPNSARNHPALALFHHGSNPREELPKLSLSTQPAKRYADVIHDRVSEHNTRKVDVIVCVHNAVDVAKLCLNSVAAHRTISNHRIIVVNDGSDIVTTAWLEDFVSAHPNVRLVRHDQATGYTKAANAGLRVVDADMAILLNSDTVVARLWIDKLVDSVFSHPGVGIVGPLSSAASHQSIPNHLSTSNQTAINALPHGYSVADMNSWCEYNSPSDFLPRVPLVHGFCFALSLEVLQTVGLFDEKNFPLGYGEENDYCFRAVNAGFSLAVATHTYIYHKKSQSYKEAERLKLAKNGNSRIRDLHGSERVVRAIRAMENNPYLERMRTLSSALYQNPDCRKLA